MTPPRTMNLEPHWPSILRFYQRMEETDPKQFAKQMALIGEDEYEKIKAASARVLEEEAQAKA